MPSQFIEIDPALLHLPPTRRAGADPWKLSRQIARHNATIDGLPPPWVAQGVDGKYMILDGVTRATRIAKLLPGQLIVVEIVERMKSAVGHLPTVGSRLS